MTEQQRAPTAPDSSGSDAALEVSDPAGTSPDFLDSVPLGRIFLHLSNPRHEPVSTEAQAIAYLCEEENVHALARDIATFGLNPLERFALVLIDPSDEGKPTAKYTVAEGNRRICALKLLHDPELAPATLRKSFEKLAESWRPITTVAAAVFHSLPDAKIWLDRIHNGPQGGIGRQPWSADQKARFDGSNRNKPAQALLDYAESSGFITAEERKGKLTTVARFLSNDVFRGVLGFDQSNPDAIARTRPKAEFDLIAKRFVRDLLEGKEVTSRKNKGEIIKYSWPLNGLAGVTSTHIEPESLDEKPKTQKPTVSRKIPPKHPKKAVHVTHEGEIQNALRRLGNSKLEALYYSICSVELDPHTPLVSVGVWSFFETLTACAGRNEGTSFQSFLSKNRLQTYGLGAENATLQQAIARIAGFGNTTKHHPIAALFNGDQLNNDMTTLKTLLVGCIEEAAKLDSQKALAEQKAAV